MNLEDFKKDFDEKLAAMSDEQIIQEFKDMGCDVKIKQKVVVILRGASGSGKSSVTKLFGDDVYVCSADHYFMDDDGNYNFDPSKLGAAHGLCKMNFISGLQNPDIDVVVVDNTNTKQSDFQFYVDEAEKRGAMVISLVVEKRHNGVNSHNVPEHVIDRHVENTKNTLKLR